MLGLRNERRKWPIPLPLGNIELAQVLLMNQGERFMGFDDVQRTASAQSARQLGIVGTKKRVPCALKSRRRAKRLCGLTQTRQT